MHLPLRAALLSFCLSLSLAQATAQTPVRVPALPAADVIALTADGTRLYAATYGRVYASADGGDTWTPTPAFAAGTGDLSALQAHDGLLYAGTVEAGVRVSRDGGATWQDLSSGLEGLARRITAFAVRGDSLYAATDGAGIYALDLQQPAAWHSFNDGFGAEGVRTLAADGEMLVAGAGMTGGVYSRKRRDGAWTRAAFDGTTAQIDVRSFLPAGGRMLAGTNDGLYIGSPDGRTWTRVWSAALPEGSDVVGLTRLGSRTFAAVRVPGAAGTALYASVNEGQSWILHGTHGSTVHDLIGAAGRLWLGRPDGLWRLSFDSEPALFQARLTRTEGGYPVHLGSTLALLRGHDLRLMGGFSTDGPDGGRGWFQIDLYRGAPGELGELVENLGIALPAPAPSYGAFDHTVTLTDAQLEDLNSGRLFVRVWTGSRAMDLRGQIGLLPLSTPLLFETRLSTISYGVPTWPGQALATLEGRTLRVVGMSRLVAAWVQLDLYRGSPADAGTYVANVATAFPGPSVHPLWFDRELELTDAQVDDLTAGRLYLRLAMLTPEGIHQEGRGQLLAETNQAPAASGVTSPGDGTTLAIGGTDGAPPVDPATPLAAVAFTAAADPDGHAVAYYWQVSRDANFGQSATATLPAGRPGTPLVVTAADLAAVFDALWPGRPGGPPLQTPVPLFHRMLTTDGVHYSAGPALSMTVVRGTVVAVEPEPALPGRFALLGNYPNPFNPSTTVTFDLPAAADVGIEVFNLLGQRVLSIPARSFAAGGAQRLQVDAAALPSGAYLYRITASGPGTAHVATGRMTVLK